MNWLWRALTRNLILKFSALVCAVVLWAYVDGFVPVERTHSIPVGFFSPDGREVEIVRPVKRPPDAPPSVRVANVTVRGPSRVVRTIKLGIGNVIPVSPGRITVRTMALSTGMPADEEPVAIKLLRSDFRFGVEDVRVTRIDPPEILLRLKGRKDRTQTTGPSR